jgi:hypothetical protein
VGVSFTLSKSSEWSVLSAAGLLCFVVELLCDALLCISLSDHSFLRKVDEDRFLGREPSSFTLCVVVVVLIMSAAGIAQFAVRWVAVRCRRASRRETRSRLGMEALRASVDRWIAKTEAKGSDVTRERECFCNLDDMIGWLDFERRVVAVVDSK